MNNANNQPVFDPYDPWLSKPGVWVKKKFYRGDKTGKLLAIMMGLMDWFLPGATRFLFRSKPRYYPIVVCQEIIIQARTSTLETTEAKQLLKRLKEIATDPTGKSGWSWGLGFPWMSKNGLYQPSVPFITHTPYVMEALLTLSQNDEIKLEADEMFHSSWDFLQSLLVMFEDEKRLALSYAPVEEPRMVINANSYAAMANALQAVHGRDDISEFAQSRVIKLVNWVVDQQQPDGSWLYYADSEPGNFIDCFHSCFVIKNLIKVKQLIPETEETITPSIEQAWRFVRDNFVDPKTGLCRRFLQRDIKDPFIWDIYDQAEYLGLLLDFDLEAEAIAYSRLIEKRFKKGQDWYCRIDLFGRRWGKNFNRWGIVPFMYHQSRLAGIQSEGSKPCAA